MVSVITTNYIQFILLSLGMIFITVYGLIQIGWIDIVNTVAEKYGRNGFNPFASGSQFGWSFLTWQILFQLAVLTIAPYITMRLFSSKDSKTGMKIFTWSSILFLARAVIPIFWGILALAYFSDQSGNALEAMPKMIAEITPGFLLGLIFASMLAASMSTYASYLLSWSSVISQDLIGVFVEWIIRKKLQNRSKLLISRCTMAFVILFIIWWSFFYQPADLLFFYLMLAVNLFLAGTLISAIFGLYLSDKKFGLFRAQPMGSYLAFTLGALPCLFYFISNKAAANPSLFGIWSFGLALAGMIIGSVLYNIWLSIHQLEK
jgi:SSS family solute:Na+ symporter